MAHPNEELFRRGLEAFSNGDIETLNEQFADDIVWHTGGRSRMAGDYTGKEAVFAHLAAFAQETGGTFAVEPHDVLANDEHVVALVTTRGERGGNQLEDRGVQVLHVRDGKVTESWFHSSDQYAVDEFWS